MLMSLSTSPRPFAMTILSLIGGDSPLKHFSAILRRVRRVRRVRGVSSDVFYQEVELGREKECNWSSSGSRYPRWHFLELFGIFWNSF